MTDDTTDDASPAGESGRRSKVGRVIDERGLPELGEELERRWVGAGDSRDSLRALAEHFNKRVLDAAMADAGKQALDGEADHFYRLLTDDDVTGGTRTEAERRLERAGVDVGRLRDDFVSHQAIHTYLTKYRDVEPPSNGTENRIGSARDTVQQLTSRLQAVTETTLDSLRRNGLLAIGEFDVYVDVRVTCNDCQTQRSVVELLEAGACDCSGGG